MRLNSLAKGRNNVHIHAFDITDRDQWLAVTKNIFTEFKFIDTVILNAGTCEYVDLPDFDVDLFRRVFDCNVMGCVYGIEASLPFLRQSNDPHLVIMGSSIADLALARAEAYGSSKAAIKYLIESLRLSLIPENIPVSGIYPGFIKSELTDKNDFPMPLLMSADQAAEKIFLGLVNKKDEIYFPQMFTYLLKIIGCLPLPIRKYISRRFTT